MAGREVMAMEWSVLIETAAPEVVDDDLVADALGSLLATLAPLGAAVGGDGRGWDVRLTMEADDAFSALADAQEMVMVNAEAMGLPLWPVVRAEAIEQDILDAEMDVPNFPNIVGSQEVARMLDVSRQRLHQLRATDRFPKPMVDLAATPVWLRSAIEGFLERWPRKSGRPTKSDTMDDVMFVVNADVIRPKVTP